VLVHYRHAFSEKQETIPIFKALSREAGLHVRDFFPLYAGPGKDFRAAIAPGRLVGGARQGPRIWVSAFWGRWGVWSDNRLSRTPPPSDPERAFRWTAFSRACLDFESDMEVVGPRPATQGVLKFEACRQAGRAAEDPSPTILKEVRRERAQGAAGREGHR